MAEGVQQNLKYKGIKPEIAAELELLDIQYFRFNKPVPFCGLTIYPIKVVDYEVFANCSACFTLNKNTSVEGIKMSHLDFLVKKMKEQGNEGSLWSYRLHKLFEMIFHLQNGLKCKKCGHIIAFDSQEFKDYVALVQDKLSKNLPAGSPKCSECGGEDFAEMIKIGYDEEKKHHKLIVDGKVITSADYDRLRQIVLFQNYPDYRDDSWVDPALKADYETKLELERKQNDVHATIEKKVICLSISTHYSIDEIWDMSIRHFTMALTAVDDLINYKIIRQAVMTGFVSLPKGQKIEHWIYKPEKDMYGDTYKDMGSLKEQLSRL